MGDVPHATNPAATVVNEGLHFAIDEVAVKLVDAAIIAEVPFLGNPITAELLDLVTGYIANKIYGVLATLGTFTVIDIQTHAEVGGAIAAADAMRAAHVKGDPNEIADAKKKFHDAMGALIHSDGSATA